MRMFKLICLTLLLASFAYAGDEDVQLDNAARLLSGLIQDAEKNLSDLNDYWRDTAPLLINAVHLVEGSVGAQTGECNKRTSDVAGTQEEIDTANHYIEWLSERIQSNLARVNKLEDARCEANKGYINGLKHDKIALKLIEFLRQAIKNKDSLSLVQRDQFISKLGVFFQLYTDDKLPELMQLQGGDDEFTYVNAADYDVETNTSERQRTDSEIGTGHIDSDRPDLELQGFQGGPRRDWPTYKAELLGLLDELEGIITKKIGDSQNDEVNAGVSLADFKIQIERENKQLDRYLDEENIRLGKVSARIIVEQNSLKQCQNELEAVTASLENTRRDYTDKETNYKSRLADFKSELETFKYVQKLYKDVQYGDYNGRQLDGFDFIKPRK